jgi:hypothetical protein
MTSMAAIRPESSSASTDSAVSETLRLVTAENLSLLQRRSDINRRIRGLHRLMHRLCDLSHKPALKESAGFRNAPDNVAWQAPLLAGRSKNSIARLRRACRIALMEAGGVASLDEIRSRIARRGSFSFADYGLSESAIVQTLDLMAAGTEVRCLENGSELIWQRVAPTGEIEFSQ